MTEATDNTTLNPGSGGNTVRTIAKGGVHTQATIEALDLDHLSRFLDTNGDGTGVKDASVDHSGAAEEYKIEPAATKIYYIAKLVVSVTDGGTWTAAVFGGGTALTNGVIIKTIDADGPTDLVDFTDNVPIKTNGQWYDNVNDVVQHQIGAGDEQLIAVIDFVRDYGGYLRLDGADNEFLAAVLNDDFSTLTSLYFHATGFEQDVS